jgi:putative restriction endonuclease
MPRAYVGVTDSDWFEFLSHRPDLTEVNFWQPGGRAVFKALAPGELFLFKLHSPNNFIVGGGFFAASSLLPVSLAWETFGAMNGVPSLEQMRERIARLRRVAPMRGEDYVIGNTVLEQVFFFRREKWIPIPSDFSLNVVQGKGYDLTTGTGLDLWQAIHERLTDSSAAALQRSVSDGTAGRMFSDPTLVRRRLGQGAFRVLVTDTYGRQCAATREHTLPVLEAAHIRPVAVGGEHAITNGILLRSDVHTLFDRGFVSVSPDYKFLVSGRLNEQWQNGKVYYALAGKGIHLPTDRANWPDTELLEWHSREVFQG